MGDKGSMNNDSKDLTLTELVRDALLAAQQLLDSLEDSEDIYRWDEARNLKIILDAIKRKMNLI